MADRWSGMRGVSSVPTYVVMQPTTLCNLDCAYCYLPFRGDDRRMPVEVAQAVAAAVEPWTRTERFSIVWHGGEPPPAGPAAPGRAARAVRGGGRAPRADQRDPDRRRLVRVLRRARGAGQRERRRAA